MFLLGLGGCSCSAYRLESMAWREAVKRDSTTYVLCTYLSYTVPNGVRREYKRVQYYHSHSTFFCRADAGSYYGIH